jgi:hypothetical protein
VKYCLLNINQLRGFYLKILSTKMRFIRKHILSLFQIKFKYDYSCLFSCFLYLHQPSLLYVLWRTLLRKDGRIISIPLHKGLSSLPGKTFFFSVPAKSTDDLADNQVLVSAAGQESSCKAEPPKMAGPC